MGWTLTLWVLCQAADPTAAQDDLRRARNEYAFGNYDAAAEQLRRLLEPLRLTNDGQIAEAHELLALSYYLTDRQPLAREEFVRLLELAPEVELDPYSVAPPIIDMFEDLRRELHPDAARKTRVGVADGGTVNHGVLRTIEYRSTQRSELATYLPFGVGQFQNGEPALGIFFAVAEAALLATNIGCFLAANNMHSYTREQASTVQALTVAQYSALGLFGLSWGIGAFQARLHFVPVMIETPRVQETPLYGVAP